MQTMTFVIYSRIAESLNSRTSVTSAPTLTGQQLPMFPNLFRPIHAMQTSAAPSLPFANVVSSLAVINKDSSAAPSLPSTENVVLKESLEKLTIAEQTNESQDIELPVLPKTPLTEVVSDDVVPTMGNESYHTVAKPIPLHPGDERITAIVVSPVVEEIFFQNINEDGVFIETDLTTEVDSDVKEVQIELIEVPVDEQFTGELEKQSPEISIAAEISSRSVSRDGSEHIDTAAIGESQLDNSAELSSEKESVDGTVRIPAGTDVKIAEQKEEVTVIEEKQEFVEEEKLDQKKNKSPAEEKDEMNDELSPTAEEYEEGLQFGVEEDKEVFSYGLGETHVGYIAPASTPAPSLAPLAEIETDTVDDDLSEELQSKEPPKLVAQSKNLKLPLRTTTVPKNSTTEEARKRRRKKHSDSKKSPLATGSSVEEKDKDELLTSSAASSAKGTTATESQAEADINAVCPWEDE